MEREKENFLPFPSYREHFTVAKALPDGATTFKAKCRYCNKDFSVAITSSRNMRRHIEAIHKTVFEKIVSTPKRRLRMDEQEAPPLKKLFTRQITQPRLDELVQRVIVENRLALRFVESDSFKALIQELAPHLKLMCRKTLRRRIQSKYREMKEALKDTLASVDRVCVTADAWKARGKSYIAMMALWLDPKTLECCTAALAFRRITGSQTYDVIARLLSDVFTEYNIDDKISSVVTDNGSNFCKAFREFGETISDINSDEDAVEEEDESNDDVEPVDLSSILNEGSVASVLRQARNEHAGEDGVILLPPHRRCASHTLNRVAAHDVEKALTESGGQLQGLHKSVMEKCKVLWNIQSRSSNGHDLVEGKLGRLFPLPNETRWNSKYHALRFVLSMTDSADKAQGLRELLLSKKATYFSANELTWLKEYVQVMQPLSDALDILQQETNVCVGYLLPTLHCLMKKMKEMQVRDVRGSAAAGGSLKYMRPVARCIEQSVKSRFGTLLWDKELVVAACLVPVYKVDWIRALVDGDVDDKVEEARRWLRQAGEDLGLTDEDEAEIGAGQPATETAAAAAEPQTPSTPATNAFHRLFGFSQNQRTRSAASSISEDIDRYLAGAVDEVAAIPTLRKLYIRVNTCVPSSGSVERFFSRANLVMTPTRTRLTDEHFERLVLLEANTIVFRICKN